MGRYLPTITMTGHYLYLLFFLSLSSATPFPAHQQNLLSTLFGPDYSPLFIPVKNASIAQEVFMEATLQKIMDVDVDKGVLTTLIWLDMQWEDDYLKWDPEKSGGVDRLELPPSKVWTPDIFLFNDVSGHFSDDLVRDSPLLVVTNEGQVRWIPPLVVKTMCDMTTKTTDVQTCELKFGSWVYTAHQLDLINSKHSMDLEGYNLNTEWNLESARVERHETVYECCPAPFVDITYTVRLQSKSENNWILG